MRIIVLSIAVAVACLGQQATLPDTGQTGHFTETFGQDSDYTINPPSFTDNGDGTVTDRVTGLLWQKADGGEMTWENAGAYCRSVSLAGHSDWRLPLAQEGFGILNHNYLNPALDTNVFTKSGAEYWWSAEQRADDPSRVWVTNAGGGIGPHPKSETASAGGSKTYHTRCVSGNWPVGSGQTVRYTSNQDGTVTDNHTGLTWQQTDAPIEMTWEEALKYSEGLSLAGHDDWRLPNIKELQSLNDVSSVEPSMNKTYFPNATASEYWSSTTTTNRPERAWTMDFTLGIGSYSDKTEKLRVRSVRGGGEQSKDRRRRP